MEEIDPGYWLALCRTPELGPVKQKKLLGLFNNSPENLFSSDRKFLTSLGLHSKTVNYILSPDWKDIENDLIWLDKPDHHLINIFDKRYPPLLKEVHDAPVLLFINGNPDIICNNQLGIVGSRNPSRGGRSTAYKFSGQLSKYGITVTSGMALGIDYQAHLGALDINGKTIAILGNGPDIVYPARHQDLAERIIDNGALISEFPTGVKPLAINFPRRNRIISGLSIGVLVIEAARQSGSLITANFAVEQGREIFAIPGSINNPLTKGCHFLIKQGAKLVEDLQDIIDELSPFIHSTFPCIEPEKNNADPDWEMDKDYQQLLSFIAYEPVTIDDMIAHTGLTTAVVSSMLLILELRGLVTSGPGGFYSRVN